MDLSSFFHLEILPGLNVNTLDTAPGFLAITNYCQAGGHAEMPNQRLLSKYGSSIQHKHPSRAQGTRWSSSVPRICCKCTNRVCCTWAQISLQETLDRNRTTWACCCPLPPGYSCPPTPTLAVSVLAEPGGLGCSAIAFPKAQHPEQAPALSSHARLPLQTESSSWYCICWHFIKGLAMFVVLELLELENSIRIVNFHLRRNIFRFELCSWKSVNYLMIWLETIACPNTKNKRACKCDLRDLESIGI